MSAKKSSVGNEAAADASLSVSTTTTTTKNDKSCIPLISLETIEDDQDNNNNDDNSAVESSMQIVADEIVDALKTSGFLLVSSPLIPIELQRGVLQVATQVLASSSSSVITHPNDPKKYVMIDSFSSLDEEDSPVSLLLPCSSEMVILKQYWNALEQIKRIILKCIAIGLKMDDPDYFVKLHQQNNSALRLLLYPEDTTNPNLTNDSSSSPKLRCKAHSDYGSITLLLTDGVPGLQAYVKNEWINVPYVKGSLVINIGSLLSDWTNHFLLATLHRVVYTNNDSDKPRTSIAFFADPDENVSATLAQQKNNNKETSSVGEEEEQGQEDVTSTSKMSVAEYIQWRSGGSGTERSGLAFTDNEEQRLK